MTSSFLPVESPCITKNYKQIIEKSEKHRDPFTLCFHKFTSFTEAFCKIFDSILKCKNFLVL